MNRIRFIEVKKRRGLRDLQSTGEQIESWNVQETPRIGEHVRLLSPEGSFLCRVHAVTWDGPNGATLFVEKLK